ncbi:translation initiation factor eIF-2B [Candidatus Gracilibacteria bacterium]|nr:translation initiation factor eIF-2B [Candidatus Gracilibacteria bacterium]
MQKKIDLLSKLLLELEADLGTSDTTLLVLDSLKKSLQHFPSQTSNLFHAQLQELTNVVCSTTPKFGILNFYFQKIITDFEKLSPPPENPKEFLIQEIKNVVDQIEQNKRKLLEYAEKIDIEGKNILIHDHSHTVHAVLQHLKAKGRKFKIVIAEQEHDKTQQNIEVLHETGIPFQVIPAYMLSHVHENIDMAFFGALTLKNTMDFVMDPGSHGVISELHTTKIPIYCFLKTSKFSLWKSKEREEVFYHRHTRTHCTKNIEYERIKYSHDRVPAEFFSTIITNEGLFTPKQLQNLFKHNFQLQTEKLEK